MADEKKIVGAARGMLSKKGTKVPSSSGRKKPKFLRTDWHKKIRLGRGLKKKQKWHGAKGRQNKLRLNRKGHSRRPKIGWGSTVESRVEILRVENVKDLAGVKKGEGVVIASVGLKKRKEIIVKANEMGIKVLNKYKVVDVTPSVPLEGKK